MQGPITTLLIALAATCRSVAQSSSAVATSYPASSCIFACVNEAASTAGCPFYTDLFCVCASTAYENAATSCFQSKCTAAEAQLAQTIHQDQCAYVSAVSSLSSDASTFTAAASSALVSGSSKAVSVSSAYSSYGSFLSSEYSAYGASLSSDYSSLGSSLSVLYYGESVTMTGSGATSTAQTTSTTTSASGTTANAGTSLRVEVSMMHSVITSMLGVIFGVTMLL